MAAKKGQVSNPNGRPKGVANKATMQAREAIADFVEGNVERLTAWLDQIAEENPKDAFNCFMGVVEYHIPKLARVEVKNPEGETFKVSVSAEDEDIINRHFKTKTIKEGAKNE